MQLFTIFFFALTIPLSRFWRSEDVGARCSGSPRRFSSSVWLWPPIFAAGTCGGGGDDGAGSGFDGLTYGPLGTVLPNSFPHPVRYTGSSLSFNFAGILAPRSRRTSPRISPKSYGLQYVGYYLSHRRS